MIQAFETVIGVDPGMDGAVAFYTPGAAYPAVQEIEQELEQIADEADQAGVGDG